MSDFRQIVVLLIFNPLGLNNCLGALVNAAWRLCDWVLGVLAAPVLWPSRWILAGLRCKICGAPLLGTNLNAIILQSDQLIKYSFISTDMWRSPGSTAKAGSVDHRIIHGSYGKVGGPHCPNRACLIASNLRVHALGFTINVR